MAPIESATEQLVEQGSLPDRVRAHVGFVFGKGDIKPRIRQFRSVTLNIGREQPGSW
jgi:hypothetical protein